MILLNLCTVGFGRFSPKQQSGNQQEKTKKTKVENKAEQKEAEEGLYLYSTDVQHTYLNV